MVTIRQFTGGRDFSKRGPAAEQMRHEIMKKGKLSGAQRYKRIMNKKLEEHKQEAYGKNMKRNGRKISTHAERTLKQIAERKARKAAKAERQAVIVAPRIYPTGRVTDKGQIYDVEGNIVGKINLKNGRMSTNMGAAIGKYKAKSYFTDVLIQDAITRYSPYFIRLRQQQALMQAQQAAMMAAQGGVHGQVPLPADMYSSYANMHFQHDSINVYGLPDGQGNMYGSDMGGPRQNIGATAWGARSDNVHGTFTNNAWGTVADNVWGTASSDVWGSVGGGDLWGKKSMHVWGTGSGVNHLKAITSFIFGLFGFGDKKNRQALREMRQGAASRVRGARAAASPAPSAAPRRR